MLWVRERAIPNGLAEPYGFSDSVFKERFVAEVEAIEL